MRQAKGEAAWSFKAGEKGRNRVRVFEDTARGVIFAEVVETDPLTGKRERKRFALGHADRDRAKEDAERMALALRQSERTPEVLTLDAVSQLYLDSVTPKKSAQTRQHDKSTIPLFLRCFGAKRKAADLDARDWQRFIAARRSGELAPAGHRNTSKVGDRQITYDLKLLRAILTWATVVQENGRRLLERNPLAGLPYPNSDTVSRPILSHEQYEAMLAVASQVDPLFELALVLANETGHRVSAIRLLRWSDVTLSEKAFQSSVRWRADNDKMEWEHVTPLTASAVEALRKALAAGVVIGDAPIFPNEDDPSRSASRHCFSEWWQRAEKLAKLPPATRRGWHSLRRKWATETKGAMPLKDQAHAGGWKSTATLLELYQRPDWDSMVEGLARRGTLRQVAQ